jgi:predicted metal-binding membrane protein
MMTVSSRLFAAVILMAAGLYQLTPFKAACLRHCRSPARFLSEHRRPGLGGAFRMGAHHGAYCLGCCWALMALLFVGGIMNLWWIAGLAVFVALEKLAPLGNGFARISGLALIGFGLFVGLSAP